MPNHMIYPLEEHANECSTIMQVYWDGRFVCIDTHAVPRVISPLDAKELALALYQFYLDNEKGVI